MLAELATGHPVLVHVAGMIATLTSLILWLPQMRTTWRHRNNPKEMASISVATQYILILSQFLWLFYGLLINSFWVWASIFVNLPSAFLTLVLIYRAKHHLNRTAKSEQLAVAAQR